MTAARAARMVRPMDIYGAVTEERVRLVAAVAMADPRTVRAYMTGKPVKGAALRERIAAAVKKIDGGLVKEVKTIPARASKRAAKKGGAK